MTETTPYRSQIAAPAADVLAWHGSPGAFERLTPPWMDVRVMEAAGGIAPGDWKRLRVAAGPIGVSWTLVHQRRGRRHWLRRRAARWSVRILAARASVLE